jgi:hypothetical protein
MLCFGHYQAQWPAGAEMVKERSPYSTLEKMQRAITEREQITTALRWLNLALLVAGSVTLINIVLHEPNAVFIRADDRQTMAADPSLILEQLPQGIFHKPLNYYLEPAGRRSLFESVDEKKDKTREKQAQYLANIREEIRLIGVLLGREPQVILEKIRTGETVFVTRGEKIVGAMVVDIQQEKVVLNYQNVEVELIR